MQGMHQNRLPPRKGQFFFFPSFESLPVLPIPLCNSALAFRSFIVCTYFILVNFDILFTYKVWIRIFTRVKRKETSTYHCAKKILWKSLFMIIINENCFQFSSTNIINEWNRNFTNSYKIRQKEYTAFAGKKGVWNLFPSFYSFT